MSIYCKVKTNGKRCRRIAVSLYNDVEVCNSHLYELRQKEQQK